MHLRVAIHATSAEYSTRYSVIVGFVVVDLLDMPSCSLFLVTVDAQKGLFTCKRSTVDRAMRVMAQGAIFSNGKMLEKEGTAFFRVAHITIIVNSEGVEATGTQSAMRIVALAAGHLVLFKRVTVGPISFCPDIGMTDITDIRFALTTPHIVFTVDFVAVGTSHSGIIVRTSPPMLIGARLVALLTGIIDHIGAVAVGLE